MEHHKVDTRLTPTNPRLRLRSSDRRAFISYKIVSRRERMSEIEGDKVGEAKSTPETAMLGTEETEPESGLGGTAYPELNQVLEEKFATCTKKNGDELTEKSPNTWPGGAEYGISDRVIAGNDGEETGISTESGAGRLTKNTTPRRGFALPPSSNLGNPCGGYGNPNIDNPWTTMTSKKNEQTNPTASTLFRTGINITRTMVGESSAIALSDLKVMAQIIAEIDPAAMISSRRSDTAKKIKVTDIDSNKTIGIDLKTLMDAQTYTWGRASENKTKTSHCFTLHSNVIGNVKQLRENERFNSFLTEGHCSMQATQLRESRSRVVAYIEGKDPNHTYRTELAQRISMHLTVNSDTKRQVPVHVFTKRENGVSILAMAVGNSDFSPVKKILDKTPFEDLDLIMQSWRRTNKNDFDTRIKQHAMIVQQSRGIKLADIDPVTSVPWLRKHLQLSESGPYIIDVCTASHSHTSGVAYVQFLEEHREVVTKSVKEYIDTNTNAPTPGSRFPIKGRFASDASQNPTMASRGSVGTMGTIGTVPKSRFAQQLSNSAYKQPAVPKAVPAAISTKPRTFADALRGVKTAAPTNNEPLTDDETTITKGASSKKTLRERALEEKNEQLEKQIKKLQTQVEFLMKQLPRIELPRAEPETQSKKRPNSSPGRGAGRFRGRDHPSPATAGGRGGRAAMMWQMSINSTQTPTQQTTTTEDSMNIDNTVPPTEGQSQNV